VNGVEAHGGVIDAAGAIALGDMLYVQSGYSLFAQLPGNALLAFRVRD
jgi:polyvinyl alcohol dehydrogenase (cytochrome)